MRLLRLQATNTPKMKLHFLREAITRGYAATSAETIVGIADEIIGRAVQLSEKAALAAARAELRETIDAASSAEGNSVKSYAALSAAIQAAEAALSDENSLYCDISLAGEDILTSTNALVKMPESVSNVLAIAGGGHVTVKWNKVQDAAATAFCTMTASGTAVMSAMWKAALSRG